VSVEPAAGPSPALIEVRDVAKRFGSVTALEGISASFRAGEVTCVLGDNGAGKSTLIKILSGVFPPDEGTLLLDGRPVRFGSPRDAREAGISTVYQDLAIAPLMSAWRNFFLGNEPTRSWGPFRWLDVALAKRVASEEMAKMGISLTDLERPMGTMSGGERQSLAIARAVYSGARVLILDEPTAALGVKQSGNVLRQVVAAKRRGLAVILITHNPNHAYPVGDRFIVLQHGRKHSDFRKGEVPMEDVTRLMAGGREFDALVASLGEEPIA
jgi:simple sugar transport system ATP-binding protein